MRTNHALDQHTDQGTRRSRRRPKLALGIALTAAMVGGLGTWAHAAIPATRDGRVTACYSAANPALRVVDAESGKACASGETALSWFSDGMRWAGVWTDGPNGSVPPSALIYGLGNRGKVIRTEVPVNRFGCTTPHGLWVAITDSYAYPCVEYPQNWKLLMVDPPKVPDVHHYRIADGKVVASSDALDYTYFASGYGYLRAAAIKSLAPCSITATVNSYSAGPLVVTAEAYGDSYILYTTRKPDGTFVSAPVSITAVCNGY